MTSQGNRPRRLSGNEKQSVYRSVRHCVAKSMTDLEWMNRAIELAYAAQTEQEVPVGALLVKSGQILAEGYNQPISKSDPTAHAEIQVLRKAAENLGNYRLLDTTLYVTLEPCLMCLGAIIHARIKRLVFGAYDAKAGAVVSAFHLIENKCFNHRLDWTGGVQAKECGLILSRFFQEKRTLLSAVKIGTE